MTWPPLLSAPTGAGAESYQARACEHEEWSWRGSRVTGRRGSRPIGMSVALSSALALVAGAKRCCMTARAALQLVPSATTSRQVMTIERRTYSGCVHGITSARRSGKLRLH
nr:MAG TPA: hypothetical protein [Caudoviricetes sp.]